jgi:hypothetical protein
MGYFEVMKKMKAKQNLQKRNDFGINGIEKR